MTAFTEERRPCVSRADAPGDDVAQGHAGEMELLARLLCVDISLLSPEGEVIRWYPQDRSRVCARDAGQGPCECCRRTGTAAAGSKAAVAERCRSGAWCAAGCVLDRGRVLAVITSCGYRSREEALEWSRYWSRRQEESIGAQRSREGLEHTVKELLHCYEELNLLYDLAEALHGKLDRNEVAGIAVGTIAEGLEVEKAALFSCAGPGEPLELVAGIGCGEDATSETTVEEIRAAADEAASTAKPVMHGCGESGWGHLLAIPMKVREKVTGAIAVADARSGRGFGSGEQKILQTAACHVTAVLEDSQLYSQVKNFSRDLERRVEEAMAELVSTRDQLVKAEKSALVGQLAVTVNHEINNPLCVILATCQVLARDMEDAGESDIRDGLRQMEDSARAIAWKVKRLTDIVEPVVRDYVAGVKMIDIDSSIRR